MNIKDITEGSTSLARVGSFGFHLVVQMQLQLYHERQWEQFYFPLQPVIEFKQVVLAHLSSELSILQLIINSALQELAARR